MIMSVVVSVLISACVAVVYLFVVVNAVVATDVMV